MKKVLLASLMLMPIYANAGINPEFNLGDESIIMEARYPNEILIN